MWLQRLTTREPTLDQLEVSIRALARCCTSKSGRARDAQRVEIMA